MPIVGFIGVIDKWWFTIEVEIMDYFNSGNWAWIVEVVNLEEADMEGENEEEREKGSRRN